MKKSIIPILIIISAAGFIFLSNRNNKSDTADIQSIMESEIPETPMIEEKMYTLEEISAHNQPANCWFAIKDNVYNVTDLIASNKHPGGEAILQGCGLDATEAYTTRPMGSGTDHSEKAYGMLESYKIGKLK